ncbi:hypothetical protein ACOME3_008991 [Neoechinorhynchus agilis]
MDTSDQVRYEVIDASGNKLEIGGNIGQLKQWAGSIKELKQPDGTVIKEYVLDDPEILQRIRPEAEGNHERPFHHSHQQKQHNDQQYTSNASNRYQRPSFSDLTDELKAYSNGELYSMRCSTGKHRILPLEYFKKNLCLTELFELRDALQSFLTRSANRNNKQSMPQSRPSSYSLANNHELNDYPVRSSDYHFKPQAERPRDYDQQAPHSNQNIRNTGVFPGENEYDGAPLIDLSSINASLGTYPIDKQGRIVGDISYQLTRDELEFIKNQLRNDGIHLNLSNIIPRSDRREGSAARRYRSQDNYNRRPHLDRFSRPLGSDVTGP